MKVKYFFEISNRIFYNYFETSRTQRTLKKKRKYFQVFGNIEVIC